MYAYATYDSDCWSDDESDDDIDWSAVDEESREDRVQQEEWNDFIINENK